MPDKKDEIILTNGSAITVKFADSLIPIFKEERGSDYIKFGLDDKYPAYLINLLDKSAKHGSIVKSKTTYIFGGGMKADQPNPASEIFIKRYNPLVKKSILDVEAFGMGYIQCIPTRDGKGWGFYHMSYERVRMNKDHSLFYYKKDWQDKREIRQEFNAFDPAIKRNSVLMFKEYSPGQPYYGLPGFVASCNYIESDIQVSKHTLTNAKGGFSATKFINFFNGEPNEAQKRSIDKRFTNDFTGAEGKKIIIGYNNPSTTAPTIDDLGASDLTKEDFSAVDNLISTNLYAGHQVTNPALFGIPPATSRSLGNDAGNELKMAFDMFKNTYVAGKKLQIESIINFLASAANIGTNISLIDVEPVGYEFTEATLLQVAPRSWLLEKLGIDPLKYPDAPVVAQAAKPAAPGDQPTAPGAPGQHEAVNENIKNLSAKQHQQLTRIIRQYSKGSITREVATVLLKTGLGLNDADINSMLPAAKFSTEEDCFMDDNDVALLFEAHGEPRDGYNSFERRLITAENFSAADSFATYSDLEDKINIIRKAKPAATAAQIAKELNISADVVSEYIGTSGGGIAGIVAKLPKFEIRYSYEKRADVEGADVLPTTRPFCKKMIALNRFYTRADIQNISQFLGYDVMRRAGGFWNNNGTIETHCRHEFFSQIVIKKL